MNDYVFVETINIGRIKDDEFDLSADKNAHLREDLMITPDGKILAVKRERVAPFIKDEDVYLVRMGRKSMPREIKIKNDDDFWKFMAYLVELDEDI